MKRMVCVSAFVVAGIFFVTAILAAEPAAKPAEPAAAVAQPKASEAAPMGYADFGIGGAFPVSSGTYPGIDPRFQFQLELGGQYGAFPISFSTGQSIKALGIKPRIQYFFAPVSSLPKLLIAPGVGFVLNYYRLGDAATVGVGSANEIELGVQLGAFLRYNITKMFNVMFTPAAVDLNFWRKSWGQAGTGSETKTGVIYNVIGSAGLNF